MTNFVRVTRSQSAQAQKLAESVWWSIPEPVFHKILARLGPQDVLNAGMTCRRWNQMSKDDFLWKKLFHRDFKVDPNIGLKPEQIVYEPEVSEAGCEFIEDETEDTNVDFIRAIEIKTCLWDTKDADYHNRSKVAAAWAAIRKGFPGNVNERWRSFRNSYIRWKRSSALPSGSGAKPIKAYKYEECLMFLDGVICPRNTTSTLRERNEQSASTSRPALETEAVVASVERVDEQLGQVLSTFTLPQTGANEHFGNYIVARFNAMSVAKATRLQIKMFELLSAANEEEAVNN